MWSKPAPPSDSGSATAVRPSSAALRNVSRGKCPVTSISRASGFTSFSANSRTVRCSNVCSSVSEKFNGGSWNDVAPVRRGGRALLSQSLAQFRVGRGKLFRLEARFAHRGHEIRVAGPAGHEMHMEMMGNAGAGRGAQIHARVDAVRMEE